MKTVALVVCILGAAQAQFPNWPPIGWPGDWGNGGGWPFDPQPQPQPTNPGEALQCSCGVENTATRIIGGIEARPNRYPWMVALVQPNNPRAQFCGGTLISDRHVLTAAHCFDQTSEGQVHAVVGAHRLSQVSPQTTIPVSRIIRHEAWDNRVMKNDITILVLARPVTMSDKVRPACLPTASMTQLNNYFVTGWGTLNPQQQVSADALMEVPSPEIPIGVCERTWPGVSTQTQICGGRAGASSCRGDSGGPLASRVNGKTYHTGIVSFGPRICANGDAAIYTRVSAYLQWIAQRTSDGRFCAN